MENLDDNDEETNEHAMAPDTSDKNGPKTPKQTMKTSDENDQKTFRHVCKICDKSFSRKQYLKSHIRNIHEGIKDFECDACDQLFSERKNLIRHKKSYTNVLNSSV